MAYTMGETPLQSLAALLQTGAARADAATDAARSGVSAVTAGGAQIQNQIGDANQSARAAQGAASGMSYDINELRNLVGTLLGQADKINGTADTVLGQAGRVNDTAGEVKTQAGVVNNTATQALMAALGLAPYADSLNAKGEEMFASGTGQVGRANGILDIGQGLLDLNPSSSPIAREFINALNSLSGDSQVSMAAHDVQTSFDTAYQQLIRGIARSGGFTGSGSSVAKLQKQYAQTLATAKAAAKTRARISGVKDRLGILGTLTDKANTILGTGNQMFQTGTTAQNAGAAAVKSAADVQTAMAGGIADAGKLQATAGELFGTAGQLQASAGNLQASAGNLQTSAGSVMGTAAETQARAGSLGASQADAYAGAGSLFVSAGQLENSYLTNINSAYNNLSDALTAAASYYQSAAATEVGAVNGGGGGGGGGGGVKITNSDDDDWMNWRGTGHSETWNQNDNFRLAKEIGAVPAGGEGGGGGGE